MPLTSQAYLKAEDQGIIFRPVMINFGDCMSRTFMIDLYLHISRIKLYIMSKVNLTY
jgi:hypothetical protein